MIQIGLMRLTPVWIPLELVVSLETILREGNKRIRLLRKSHLKALQHQDHLLLNSN